jgi:hypothetical protein
MIAGLGAGVTYLVAQMSFMATLMGGTGTEPLQRISALLLGPEVLPPADGLTPTIVGMALLIHLPLAALYGRLVGWVIRRVAPMWIAAAGMATGFLLFAFNFWILAPLAFPWFVESRHVATAFDHALFGIVAAGWTPPRRPAISPRPPTAGRCFSPGRCASRACSSRTRLAGAAATLEPVRPRHGAVRTGRAAAALACACRGAASTPSCPGSCA